MYVVKLKWPRLLRVHVNPETRRVSAHTMLKDYSFAQMLYDLTGPRFTFGRETYDPDTQQTTFTISDVPALADASDETNTPEERVRINTPGPSFIYSRYSVVSDDDPEASLAVSCRATDPDFHRILEHLASAGSQEAGDHAAMVGEYVLILMESS